MRRALSARSGGAKASQQLAPEVGRCGEILRLQPLDIVSIRAGLFYLQVLSLVEGVVKGEYFFN
jgi:hypothetical protein